MKKVILMLHAALIFGASSFAQTSFVQGGNSFGAIGTLGTNDNYSLSFRTNGTEKMNINNVGQVTIGTTDYGKLTVGNISGGLKMETPDAVCTFQLSNASNSLSVAVDEEFGDASFNVASTGSMYFNASRFSILSDGKVGIGTASPSEKLELSSTSATQLYTKYKNSATTNGFSMGVNSAGNAVIWHNDNKYIAFGANNGECMRISKNGSAAQVAIGTTITDGVNLKVSTPDDDCSLQLVGGGMPLTFGVNTEFGDAYCNVASTGSMFFNTNRLAILSNGNVGIGTASPVAKLHVAGDIKADGPITILNTNPGLWIIDSDGNMTNYHTSVDNNGVHMHTDGNLNFEVEGGLFRFVDDENGECMSINAFSGLLNFGMGGTYWLKFQTSDKTVRVDGTVYAKEVKVRTNVWADNVFSSNYKLRTLAETEQYIKENQHLPEVPSEKEVLANGIDVAQMNVVLLKKVEELTLHMIEQNKRLEALEKENAELKK